MPGWLNKGSRWIRGFSQRVDSEEEEVRSFEMVRALGHARRRTCGVPDSPEGQQMGPPRAWSGEDGPAIGRHEEDRGGRADRRCHPRAIRDGESAVSGGMALRPALQYRRRAIQGSVRGRRAPALGHGVRPHLRKPHRADQEEPVVRRQRDSLGRRLRAAWLACLIKSPFEPLPVLATVGEEDSGKSIWYEGIREYLLTRGVVSVNEALTRQDSFNGELEGALCVSWRRSRWPTTARRWPD